MTHFSLTKPYKHKQILFHTSQRAKISYMVSTNRENNCQQKNISFGRRNWRQMAARKTAAGVLP